MKTYKTINGQNIFDVALMTHGNIEGVTDLLRSNEGLSINDNINSGTVLNYTETPNAFTDFVETRGVVVATEETENNTGRSFDSGFDNSFK